jgi:5,5'-dehydrodivanillate O-demethylase oxygenase subunit
MSTKSTDAQEIDFVRTGPGTMGGCYLRRFWQPIYLSHDLAKGRAVPIRIMGDEFTLYRGKSGRPYVTQHRCPHRGEQLSNGWVRGEELSCRYHGWTFDPTGQCTAQPAEPQPFCSKVKVATYPAREAIGWIFAYLGEGAPPPFPEWPKLGQFPHRHRMDCNYFQSAENIVDDVHLHFSHRKSPLRHSRRAGIPRVFAHETPFGLTQENRYARSTELNHFIMPNMCYLQFDYFNLYTLSTLFAYVPIDDTHHNHFMSTAVEATWLPKALSKLIFGSPIVRWFYALRSGSRDERFSKKSREALSGRRTFDRVTNGQPRFQDTLICVGQGEIANRSAGSAERLGRSDAAVILLRKIWKRELRLLAEGKPLTQFTFPQFIEASGEIAGLELVKHIDPLSAPQPTDKSPMLLTS